MALSLVTKPTEEPLALQEIKDHLRVTHTDDDDQIISLMYEARKYVEDMTGRALITQTWDWILDDFKPILRFPKVPVQSVSSISYQDLDDTTQTLASTVYTVDTNRGLLVEAYSQSWPTVYPELESVTIRFICGYGARKTVPERLKQAIKLYVQWIYDQDSDAKMILDNFINQDKVNWFEQDD